MSAGEAKLTDERIMWILSLYVNFLKKKSSFDFGFIIFQRFVAAVMTGKDRISI